jgi:hypothetical protein
MAKRPPSPASPAAENELLGQMTTLNAIKSPLLLKALAIWTEKKGTRRMPARDDMTPRAMAPFLRNTALVKVIDGGREYQFRVVGDAVTQVQGQSYQGLTLTEVDKKLPGYGSLLRPVHDVVVARAEPLAFRGHIRRSPTGRMFFHETVILPLGSGDAVDHFLVVVEHVFESGVEPKGP